MEEKIKTALSELSKRVSNTEETLDELVKEFHEIKQKQLSNPESNNEEDEWDLLDMDEGYDDDYRYDDDYTCNVDEEYFYYLGEPFLKLIKERKPFEFNYCEEGKMYKLKIKEYEVVDAEEEE